MSKKIRYSDEPIRAEVIRDFLPSPERLVIDEDGVKVTISLSRRSVDFFKSTAERNNTSYQRMIRRLLDAYTEQYAGELTKRSTRRARTHAR